MPKSNSHHLRRLLLPFVSPLPLPLRDPPRRPSAKLPNSILVGPFPARNASSLSTNGSSPGSGFLRPYLSKRSGRSTVSSDAGLAVAFRSTLGCGCEELGPEVDDDGSYERARR